MSKNTILKTISLSLILALCAGFSFVNAAKMDINTSVTTKAISHYNLNFATTPVNKSFMLTDSSLGVLLNDYIAVPDKDIFLDIGLALRAVGVRNEISAAAGGLPYSAIASSYPSTNFLPFVEQAYLRLKNLFDIDLSLTVGRQKFILGNGLLLADNDLGLTGFNIEYDSKFHGLQAGFFAFQPLLPANTKSADLIGFVFKIPSNGLWQFYLMREIKAPTTTFTAGSSTVTRTVKDFAAVSYYLKTGQLVFEGEGALQRGYAKKINSSETVSYNSNAFLIKGTWVQKLSKLGAGSAHIAFGRASGDKVATASVDESFFPSYGQKYKGFERKGFGEVFGATLYDAWGGDSTTVNGLPAGLSGIQVFNMGLQFPPKWGIHTTLDFFAFEADTSTVFHKKLGTEFDIKFYYLLGDAVKMIFAFGTFSPSSAYPDGTKSPKKLSFEINARF